MIFDINNKSHFLYYFHGIIFLRFNIFKWNLKSTNIWDEALCNNSQLLKVVKYIFNALHFNCVRDSCIRPGDSDLKWVIADTEEGYYMKYLSFLSMFVTKGAAYFLSAEKIAEAEVYIDSKTVKNFRNKVSALIESYSYVSEKSIK